MSELWHENGYISTKNTNFIWYNFSILFLIDIMERLFEETENYSISTQEKESAESFAILLFLIGLIFSLLITYNLSF